jgi:hypothetical protein
MIVWTVGAPDTTPDTTPDTAPFWMLDSLCALTCQETYTLFTAVQVPRFAAMKALQEHLAQLVAGALGWHKPWPSADSKKNADNDDAVMAWLVEVIRRAEVSKGAVKMCMYALERLLCRRLPGCAGDEHAEKVQAWVACVRQLLATHSTCSDAPVHTCVQALVVCLTHVVKMKKGLVTSRVLTEAAAAVGDVVAAGRVRAQSSHHTDVLTDCMHVLELLVSSANVTAFNEECDIEDANRGVFCGVDWFAVRRFAEDCLHRFNGCARTNYRLTRLSMSVLVKLADPVVGLAMPFDATVLTDVKGIATTQGTNVFVMAQVTELVNAAVHVHGDCDEVLAFVPVLAEAMTRFADNVGVVSQCAAYFAAVSRHSENKLLLAGPAVFGAVKAAFLQAVSRHPREEWTYASSEEFGVGIRAFCEYYCNLASHSDNWGAVMGLAPALVSAASQATARTSVDWFKLPWPGAVSACADCFASLTAFGAADRGYVSPLVDAGVVPWIIDVLERRWKFGSAVRGCAQTLANLAINVVTPLTTCQMVSGALLLHGVLEKSIDVSSNMCSTKNATAYACIMFFRAMLDQNGGAVRAMCCAVATPALLAAALRQHGPAHTGTTVEVLQCFIRLSTPTSDLSHLYLGVKCVEAVLLGPQGGSVEVAERCAALLWRLVKDQSDLSGDEAASAVKATISPLRRLLERFGSEPEVARHCLNAFSIASDAPVNRPAVLKELALLGTVAARHTEASAAGAFSCITRNLSGGRHGSTAAPSAKLPKPSE